MRASKGLLLKREIEAGSRLFDAMNCPPYYCCRHWDRLQQDLDRLQRDLVTVTMVTDPFADTDKKVLADLFHHVRPYKSHFTTRTGPAPETFVNRSHRQHAEKALKKVDIEVCDRPIDFLDDWQRLYSVLASRHGITGVRRLPPEALARQLLVPGLVMFRSVAKQRTVGLDLWFVQGDVAHGHLVAFDEEGYRLRASYASKWSVLQYFSKRVEWINLGAGTTRDATDGLSYFKSGFSNSKKPTWICGRINDPDAYDALCRTRRIDPAIEYFPAYRSGEFVG